MELQHFSHPHPLVFHEEQCHEADHKPHCNGCGELVSGPSFSCVPCGFHLHKSCAEAPLQMKHPFHGNHVFDVLTSSREDEGRPSCNFCAKNWDNFMYHCSCNLNLHIKCPLCSRVRCGFACELLLGGMKEYICVWCGKISMTSTSQGHQHPLLLYYKYEGQLCNACGKDNADTEGVYRCKDCNYNVHFDCTFLPLIVRHKCDEHNLSLTYQEDNDYLEFHHCDICEEKRNPNTWFYHCTICDTSTHLTCAMGDYSFIKPGIKICKKSIHPHSLVFVKNSYQYPAECRKCYKRCLDSFLECEETGCDYMIHFKCAINSILD